jgi:hypothetical protein
MEDDARAEVLSRIDLALEPVKRAAAIAGPLNSSHLAIVANAIRQSFGALLADPPGPGEEPRIEDPTTEGGNPVGPVPGTVSTTPTGDQGTLADPPVMPADVSDAASGMGQAPNPDRPLEPTF